MREATRRAMRGVAAIEFAMVGPLLLIMLAGVLDIGFRMFESMQVQDAAEAGALYVSKYGWNPADSGNIDNIVTAVETATVAGGSTTSGITASPPPSEFCGCPAGGVITSPESCGGTPCSCTGTPCSCAGTPCAGKAAGSYVQINSLLTHTSFITYPGLALPATLTGYAIVRVN